MSERILNWLIFSACVFITVICFINTGILWPVTADTQDVIELNTGYLDFVKIMNLIFGFIFLILSVVFLIRALSTYDGKFNWAKKLNDKYFSKLNNIIKNRNKELDERLASLNQLLSQEKNKPEPEIIPSNYGNGRLIDECKLTNPSDKAPVIAGDKNKVDNVIDLGDFRFKGTNTTTAPISSSTSKTLPQSKPLDALKAYYVSQNLTRRNR